MEKKDFLRNMINDIAYIISGQKAETDFLLSFEQKKSFLKGWEIIKQGVKFDEDWASQEEVIDLVLEGFPYQEMSPQIDWSPFEKLTWLEKIEALKQVFDSDLYQVFRN